MDSKKKNRLNAVWLMLALVGCKEAESQSSLTNFCLETESTQYDVQAVRVRTFADGRATADMGWGSGQAVLTIQFQKYVKIHKGMTCAEATSIVDVF